MTKFNAHRIADNIERNLRAAGFSVGRDGSGLSSSQYITAAIYDDEGGYVFEQVKIRVSDHALPPTYGSMNGWADYEVGPHYEAVSDWTRVVVRLCERAGLAIPATVRALITRQASAKAKMAVAEAGRAAELAPFYAALEAKKAWVDAEMTRLGLDHLTGAKRKDARYKLNKKYEAANA